MNRLTIPAFRTFTITSRPATVPPTVPLRLEKSPLGVQPQTKVPEFHIPSYYRHEPIIAKKPLASSQTIRGGLALSALLFALPASGCDQETSAPAVCGNGIVEEAEECDDGVKASSTCDSQCLQRSCDDEKLVFQGIPTGNYYGRNMAAAGNVFATSILFYEAMDWETGVEVCEKIDGSWFKTDLILDGNPVPSWMASPLATNGDSIAYAADSNSVKIYGKKEDGRWAQETSLIYVKPKGLQDAVPMIAMEGNTLVVAAHSKPLDQQAPSSPPNSSTILNIFQETEGEWLLKTLEVGAPLRNPQVAIQGNTIAVSSLRLQDDDPETAGLYLFERGEDSAWKFKTHFNPDNAEEYLYGSSVALDGDDLIVGAENSAYVYKRTDGEWEFDSQLKPDMPNQNFGYQVAIKKGRIVVTAPAVRDFADDTPSDANQIFVYDNVNGEWRKSNVLGNQRLQSGLGYSLAWDGERLMVGAPVEGGSHETEENKSFGYSGAVYNFDL